MPVNLGTVDGHADYTIVKALKSLQSACDANEGQLTALRADLADLRRQLQRLDTTVDANQRLLQQMQQQVTQLTP